MLLVVQPIQEQPDLQVLLVIQVLLESHPILEQQDGQDIQGIQGIQDIQVSQGIRVIPVSQVIRVQQE